MATGSNPATNFDWQNFSTGILVPPASVYSSAGVAVTASSSYGVRFLCPVNLTITKIAFVLTVAAGSNDNCDVGIFNAAGTTLLVSAGSTAGKLNAAAPSVQSVTVTATALAAGTVYYAAFASGPIGTTAASMVMTASGNAIAGQIMGTAGGLMVLVKQAVFPLASPLSFGGTSNAPMLALLA